MIQTVVMLWPAISATGAPSSLPSLPISPTQSVLDLSEVDGWQTEAFSAAAKSQLEKLQLLLQNPATINLSSVSQLAGRQFQCGPLQSRETVVAFHDGGITVERGGVAGQAVQYRGPDGLVKALKHLAVPFERASRIRASFKIFRVDLQETTATTRQYFSLSARLQGGSREQNSVWQCKWIVDAGAELPKLLSIVVFDYEQAQISSSTHHVFSDCTEAALGGNTSFKEQLMRGHGDWTSRVENRLGVGIGGYYGLSLGDCNGDGLDDVYVCQPGGLPNRLYVHARDGTVTDRSAWAGVDWLDRTNSALFVDLDNDGDQDLVLGTWPGVMFMSNDGSGRFTFRGAVNQVQLPYSMACADYDNDGDLDIYACRYNPLYEESGDVPNPIPYHDANNGAKNFLLRNDGDWQFTDVTDLVGLDVDNQRWTYAASWEDFDNDGDADLYVANDFGRNCLYRNDSGHFVNIAQGAGVEDVGSGMSVSWGDPNRDGLMDIYISNMFSAAGNRITYQDQFRPDLSQTTRGQIRRLARGNTLYINNGDETFRDASIEAGVTMGRWAWGSLFTDLNNDGWQDIVVTNGFITTEDTGDL